MAWLTLILKSLPLILALFKGVGKALEKVTPVEGAKVDEASLVLVIESLVEDAVSKVIEEHAAAIKVYVPSEEDRQRQITLDELEKLLLKDQRDYEDGNY